MSNVLSQAFKIIFDFKQDVGDLTKRLEEAEKTILRQAHANTELEGQLTELIEENETLRSSISALQKELASIQNGGV